MKHWIIITLVVLSCTLGGCSSKLAYTPEQGSPDVPVSVQHHQANGRMYVYVNSEGFPVESAVLVRSDGHLVQPAAIHRPAELSAGIKDGDYSVSGGMYGGSQGVNRSGAFAGGGFGTSGALGTGGDARLGMGTTTSRRDLAQTIVIFPLDGVGPAPWRFRVKIENYPDVSIVLPAITAN